MTLRKATDEDLLARIRSDDEPALRELLRRHYARLAEFSHGLVRRRDLAEEAVMNVFLNLWRRRETLAIKGVVRSYLFAAVGNQSLTLRKQLLRHEGVRLEDVPPAQLIASSRTEGDLLHEELRVEVEQLLLNLPPQRQLIFRMNRIEGLAYAEIADVLGLSKRTVQNHMVQALTQLAPHMKKLRETLGRDRTRRAFE